MNDDGRPLGIGVQAQVPNHFMLPCLKDRVVSDKAKGIVKDVR